MQAISQDFWRGGWMAGNELHRMDALFTEAKQVLATQGDLEERDWCDVELPERP